MPVSRRSLVHVAWATPAVSVATAPPALAASGDPSSLEVLSAQFWVRAVNGWYAVVPVVVLRNDLTVAVSGLRFEVPFPTSDFTGLIPTASDPSVPPRPQAISFGSSTLPDWTRGYVPPGPDATQVTVYLLKKTLLGAGEAVVIGDAALWDFEFAWAFANDPAVSSIPFQVRADGRDPLPGVLTRMDPPTH